MVHTVELRPTQGYDFKEIRRLVNEWVPGLDDDAEREPRSVPVPFDGSTIQFRKESVGIIVRTEDPAPIIEFVYLAACASSWAASASGDPPSFETVSYDLAGTPSMRTVGAIFTAFVEGLWDGGDVSEARRLWRRELGRMCQVEMAVRDLEERILNEGPEAALLELEAYEPEEFRRPTEKLSGNRAGELRMTPCLRCGAPRTNPEGCVSLVREVGERSRRVMPRILPVAAAS